MTKFQPIYWLRGNKIKAYINKKRKTTAKLISLQTETI